MSLHVPIDLGKGKPIVIAHGFGLRPATYRGLAQLLAERCRVVVPDLFAVEHPWHYERVLKEFTATLEERGLDRASLVGHSFGGGIQLGYAARFPERVTELVFSDTLGCPREWALSTEVMRNPARLLHLASPLAVRSFVETWIGYPRQLAYAAWWGFVSARRADIEKVVANKIPVHVLWANRDSVLPRGEGLRFAKNLVASFTVAAGPDGRVIDHDWMFQQPALFLDHLSRLELKALTRI